MVSRLASHVRVELNLLLIQPMLNELERFLQLLRARALAGAMVLPGVRTEAAD